MLPEPPIPVCQTDCLATGPTAALLVAALLTPADPGRWLRAVDLPRGVGPSALLIQLALHPLQGLVHLLEHLFRRQTELAQLGAQLLHGELGLKVFG